MIQRINPGQRITAAWLNSIVDAINGMAVSGGGDPSLLGVESSSLALMLTALMPSMFVPCRIVAVRRNSDIVCELEVGMTPVPISSAEIPSSITYDLKATHEAWRVDDVTPVYGREVRGDEARIYPAQCGMVAVYVRSVALRSSPSQQPGRPVGQLMLLPGSEVVARRRCPPSGTGLSSATLAARLGLPPIPPPQPPPRDASFRVPALERQSQTSSETADSAFGGNPGSIS